MSGSSPEPLDVTASAGTSAPLTRSEAAAAARFAVTEASSVGSLGPRLLAEDDAGSHFTAEGRAWNQRGSWAPASLAEAWAISADAAGAPALSLMMEPLALVGGDQLPDAEDGQGVGHAEDQGGEDQEPEGGSCLPEVAGESVHWGCS